eukprot:Tbor_TRINITY_DN4955_c0_g1::TRINITY_DN4955_c0_g1_i1::g.9632::m.9632
MSVVLKAPECTSFAKTPEGIVMHQVDEKAFYQCLYAQQANLIADQKYDPIPGSDEIPGQREKAYRAHIHSSPRRTGGADGDYKSIPRQFDLPIAALSESRTPRSPQERIACLGHVTSPRQTASNAISCVNSKGAIAITPEVSDQEIQCNQKPTDNKVSEDDLKHVLKDALNVIEAWTLVASVAPMKDRIINNDVKQLLHDVWHSSKDLLDSQ